MFINAYSVNGTGFVSVRNYFFSAELIRGAFQDVKTCVIHISNFQPMQRTRGRGFAVLAMKREFIGRSSRFITSIFVVMASIVAVMATIFAARAGIFVVTTSIVAVNEYFCCYSEYFRCYSEGSLDGQFSTYHATVGHICIIYIYNLLKSTNS